MILRRLSKFLTKEHIIIKQQSGFGHGRQTLENIILTSQKILEGFQRKEKSLSIFFDVASAFDKVSHEGLIFKCVNYGMPYCLVRIIKNYHEQRCFEVKVNNWHSCPWPINAGVPHVGVLSPTLYSIFINDKKWPKTQRVLDALCWRYKLPNH